jgi:hypothetical protein
MTFEREVILRRIGRVGVVDGNSAFDGAESKARWQTLLLLEDGDTAMLVLERTVYLL